MHPSRMLLICALCVSCKTTSNPSKSKVEGALPVTRADDAEGKPPRVPLAEGQPAPDVELVLSDGSKRKMSDYQGRNVVLYFYPKDDTPGCTVEAQGFRDVHEKLNGLRTIVLGVSTQDAASHRAFIDKYALPFALVIDGDGGVAEAFEVAVDRGYAARHTFLIDHGGRIARIWRDVRPHGHAEQVLATIQELAHR